MYSASESKDNRELPNILVLITDQFRYDAFGPSATPNLYKLVTKPTQHSTSTLFSSAYSSTPTCTPARAALLTGKSPWNHGMLGFNGAVNCEKYPTTVPSILKDMLGYHTAVVGKNHFGTKPSKDSTERQFIDHGYQSMHLYDGLTEIADDYDKYFDRILPGEDPLATCGLGWNDWKACPYKFEEEVHPTAWTTREALKVVDKMVAIERNSSAAQHPLFLKVSYHRPHSPYDPPKRFWEKHQQRAMNVTDPMYARNIGKDPTSWDREFFNFTESMTRQDWHGDPGEKASRTTRAAYLANVEFVDEGIGKILERWNMIHGENTVVIWLSDHGDMNGDHNLWRKGYPWEASSHIQMAMKLPKTTKSVSTELAGEENSKTTDAIISDAIVEIRDVAPTIYDILGILKNVTQLDPLINGKSLLPILQRRSKSVRNHLDLEHSIVYDKRIHWNAIVGKLPENQKSNCRLYKYIFFADTGSEQLFCVSEDPLEQIDLALNKTLHDEEILSFWRNTMVKNFEQEGRGENWVTPNGRLAIRESGTTLGPHYPCHETVAKPLWKQVQARDKNSFLQQHMMNSEKEIATERRLDRIPPIVNKQDGTKSRHSLQGFDVPFGPAVNYGFEFGIVFVATTLFLSIVVRYVWFNKWKSQSTKKNF